MICDVQGLPACIVTLPVPSKRELLDAARTVVLSVVAPPANPVANAPMTNDVKNILIN
jgi:hypothetical protein